MQEQDFDTNGDGKISQAELGANLDKIAIRPDRMKQRLDLEEDLAHMLFKLPKFLICLACFMTALVEFVPPGATHNIHRHITRHFHMDSLPEIKSIEQLYEYMELFEKQNEEMQATSTKFWCEDRYSEHRWDDHLMAPVWTCKSPRQFALSLTDDSSVRWSVLNGTSSASSSGASSSASGRRLASNSSTGGTSSGGAHLSSAAHAVRPNPACIDDDASLQHEEADPNITCASFAAHVCEIDLGITLCPLTCGYCAPFTYNHRKKFEKPQVTMLPVMVYQTRFAMTDCHGFAQIYDTQPYNPVLSLLPALDGRRNGRVLTCVDRKVPYEEDYALELECPPNAPDSHCHDGKAKFSEKHTFHGMPIYPRMLIEPHRDIMALKAMEWVDRQTESVTLSTLIYTEGVEVFTSVSIEFVVDEAGNIDAFPNMVSYRDLINASKSRFIGCLATCSVFGLIGVLLSAWYVWHHLDECRWGMTAYEFFSRGVFFIYPIVLLGSWSVQVPMAEEYDHLLHSFLDLPGVDHHSLEEGIQSYFDAKTQLYAETNWLTQHRIVAYGICYVQFLQLVFYFDAHPKMALITDTVGKAASGIIHFLMLFSTLFFMMAFMAHWMLGEQVPSFGTYAETIQSQVMMFVGEFIEADGVEQLDFTMMLMYWLYAGTFMLLVWLTLLNFFLAIIVDAFVEVKEEYSEQVVVGNFLPDLFGMFWTECLWLRYKWPSKNALKAHFGSILEQRAAAGKDAGEPKWMAELVDDGPPEDKSQDGSEEESAGLICMPEDLLTAFPRTFTQSSLVAFIYHYFNKSPVVLCPRAPSEKTVANARPPARKPSGINRKHKASAPPAAPAGTPGKSVKP